MIKDEFPIMICTFGEFLSISRKKTPNFGLKFRQIGDFLGTRIVRVFGQKYSRFE